MHKIILEKIYLLYLPTKKSIDRYKANLKKRFIPGKCRTYVAVFILEFITEQGTSVCFRFHDSKFVSIRERIEPTDEDAESGRGASLPVSPHSVEGAIGGPPGVSFLKSEVQHLGNFSLSLCGGLSDPDGMTLEKFMTHIVTYEDLCENFNMVANPDLVVRIGEK